jgi:L-ribulose-5-phosphate 4-epimerase
LSKWSNEKRMVLETARKMAEKGLVLGTSGNVSLRLPVGDGPGLLAITPTSRYYDLLTPDEIPVIDFETEPVEGDLPPSSESLMHIAIYRARPAIQAVIHAHSIYASALAVAHLKIPAILDDQVSCIGGEIGLADYAPSGSDELVGNVLSALGDKNAVLLMNHGTLGIGRGLREALVACEMVERAAEIYYLSLTLGKPHELSPEALQTGRAFFNVLNNY